MEGLKPKLFRNYCYKDACVMFILARVILHLSVETGGLVGPAHYGRWLLVEQGLTNFP
jgi:hypothetical protein